MVIHMDIVTNDESFSDELNIEKLDEFVYEVICTKYTDGDNEDDDSEAVNNLVKQINLRKISLGQKEYLVRLEECFKLLKANTDSYIPESEFAHSQKAVRVYFKKVLASLRDWEFYVGESMDPNGMVALLSYREEGTPPFVVFGQLGLK